MKHHSLLVILMFWLAAVRAQDAPVAATVDRNQILIGEQIQLNLQAFIPKNQSIHWFQVDTFSHFEILSKSKLDTQLTDKGTSLSQTLTVTSWDSGHWLIPSFVLGKSKTKPVLIAVNYTPMAPNQPYNDIKDILEVQTPLQSNWYWYLLGIAVLIALFMLFFPPHEKQVKEAPPAPPEDAYKLAQSRLQKLSAADDAKPLYTALVFILRDYLEQRKGIRSLSKTTVDIATQIKKLQIPEAIHQPLEATLQLSNMVKYAKYQPSVAEKQSSIEIIHQAITAIEKQST